MKILITGGAGFIGSNLANHHLNKGDSVIVIDNLSTGNRHNIKTMIPHPNFKFYKKNLESIRDFGPFLAKVDRIYHMAAIVGMFHVIEHPLEVLDVNINGTLKLFEYLRKNELKPLVLVASSSEVYGNQHIALSESSPLILEGTQRSHAAYPISKMGQESIALSFYNQYKIPTIVLRIFNTVGRNQNPRYGMVLPRLINQALKNEDITVFGDGKQRRAFCNVFDSINLIEKLASNKKSIGQIVNLGNKDDLSINELADLIKKMSGSKSTIKHIPFEQVYGNKVITITERRPDVSKLINLTHYNYQWPIEKTINDVLAFRKPIHDLNSTKDQEHTILP